MEHLTSGTLEDQEDQQQEDQEDQEDKDEKKRTVVVPSSSVRSRCIYQGYVKRLIVPSTFFVPIAKKYFDGTLTGDGA